MSHTAFMRNQMAQTTQKICKTLCISQHVYYEYLHEQAIEWLLQHLRNDTESVDDVMQTKVFWKWWHLHAHHRDNAWLKVTYTANPEPKRLLNDWLYYHSADRLSNMEVKHAELLFNAYANINWKEDGTSHD